ncbi:MAG TPA: maltotransferase domain-containing protein, partial [Archangium sp.]|nr:maltotransferase domain-containing protein [Archangium sp.]
MNERIGSTVIENVRPQLDAGRWPVKRVEGESLTVKADIFKEGHDVLVAVVRWRQVAPKEQATEWAEVPMVAKGNDLWEADFPLTRNGRYEFTVEAWPDLFATWVTEIKRKVDVGRDVKSELLEGAAMLRGHAERAQKAGGADEAKRFLEAAARFEKGMSPDAIAMAMDPGLTLAASKHADRALAIRYDRVLEVFVDRDKARYGSWYEFFPRSVLRDGRTHGTFRDAEKWLPYVQSLGFDVIYLPPIHPIGRTARKGKNNSLTAGPEDVGSPWAIGATEGGHKAVHPALGTLEDFKRFVQAANGLGIEIALDIAFQCSPDHPYVKEHPEWFQQRPDGTIKTAENPPKR